MRISPIGIAVAMTIALMPLGSASGEPPQKPRAVSPKNGKMGGDDLMSTFLRLNVSDPRLSPKNHSDIIKAAKDARRGGLENKSGVRRKCALC
jgi:hypothetical protein